MQRRRRVVERPLKIIAMKGDPCTGKSTLASSMTEFLKCPVFAHDDIRDSVVSLQQFGLSTECLDDQCHEAICQMALSQLRMGRLDVIIDSSLSRRSHLEQLLQISSSAGARLVIVECKPQDKYEWRQRVEQRRVGAGSYSSSGESWYKPSNWEELEKLIEGEEGYDTGDVSKIVVNTTENVRGVDLVFAAERLASSPGTHCIDDFDDWLDKLAKGMIEDEGVQERKGERRFPEIIRVDPEMDDGTHHLIHNHSLFYYSDKENSDEYDDDIGIDCRGCLKPISGSRYKCNDCELTLHKSCAELPDKKEIKPQDYPPFLRALIADEYCFPVMVRCDYCEYHDKDFNECRECLFEAFVRSAELPSVLHHPCHEHPLDVMIMPIPDGSKFRCDACGDKGKHIRYRCCDCGFQCHLTCGLLPHTGKETHHRHPLTIAALPQDHSCDEFYCDACEKKRNQRHWTYSCIDCEFSCHLSCMTSEG